MVSFLLLWPIHEKEKEKEKFFWYIYIYIYLEHSIWRSQPAPSKVPRPGPASQGLSESATCSLAFRQGLFRRGQLDRLPANNAVSLGSDKDGFLVFDVVIIIFKRIGTPEHPECQWRGSPDSGHDYTGSSESGVPTTEYRQRAWWGERREWPYGKWKFPRHYYHYHYHYSYSYSYSY